MLPCLIENKHNTEMDLKCTASVEHWQIVSWILLFFFASLVCRYYHGIEFSSFCVKVFCLLIIRLKMKQLAYCNARFIFVFIREEVQS